MDESMKALCREMADVAQRIAANGLVLGPGGNISSRWNEFMIITASGYSFETLSSDQFVGIEIATGEQVLGQLKPSSETPTHLACYRARPDVNFVVHTHPPYATAVGTTLGHIPMMVPEFPVIVPKLPVLDYITPTTQELAMAVADSLGDANSVILGNHGMVSVGRTLSEAYNQVLVTEESARIYVYSRLVGEPRVLTEKQVQDVVEAVTQP